jgi:ergothioneine biosynthesis protein EgtB
MKLLDEYRAVRARTLELASPLSPEDQGVQSMPDASPTKWHLAHTTWFFETFVLEPHLPDHRPFDPAFKFLFNSYYEGVGPQHDRARRGGLSRPSLDEVHAYRRHVDQAIGRLLEAGAVAPDVASTITLGLHHEQQHQELLLTDIKHAFGSHPLQPSYHPVTPAPARPATATPALTFQSFEGGVVWIGHEGSGFAFDNEGPRHRCFLDPFAIADRPVTCGEYLAFMRDGGYARPELWLSDGWRMVESERWRAPLYWQEDHHGETGRWLIYTLAGRRGLDLDEIVAHVSYYEADAYARWAGARLPTEEEWEHAATALAPGEPAGHFADANRLQPGRVGQAKERGLFGEVWQWTRSAYGGYPGYRVPEGPIGEYNGKFMSNQMVLRGGSCLTPAGHVRATYRNFFPPATRWQMSGIRLGRDL